MPSWRVHERWAQRLGIPFNVANFVNRLIDKPSDVQEYIDFLSGQESAPSRRSGGRMKVVTLPLSMRERHNSGRKLKTYARLQLKFLSNKGLEYVKAWYLHHTLDYIESTPSLEPTETLGRIKRTFVTKCNNHDFSRILEEVLEFCRKNLSKIVHDIQKTCRSPRLETL